uniref:Rhodanese domain-containing protein n=1 Tax=Trieres chinensis TaxID=1514140 RepID=A0A7S2EYR1_TRICV|mmetsp:Transcript_9006/g.19094  ORF Transcript_9006/g.19094 Transcript_9006/m.19094 type:complete len:232 (+) Transcript_9006:105-800(+)|eukprot:CAMPEP_0183308358 /NCGR_PEP_ID=MMETSP0160_2-20130417/21498_1 /TAXON_ID=2839 ORGANISM="Odontella Sinensis, Strain Grunow 1884" /NCGR_SAMPLE_ID=MMETSP0160_2 /ASSEMBLY_ACC=CAM_ASM_000250 /LENGTH=231 /DNA_ID=CAMNT_0025472185 /DNA_START=80 /DNA_END=775 /DNA_ORIENTATION=-
MRISKIATTSALIVSAQFLPISLAKSDDEAFRALKKGKSGKKGSKKSCESAMCTRETYSVVHPNIDWEDGEPMHNYHPQVWYHTLEDVHDLWDEGYFDYVFDVRQLKDVTMENGIVLDGWESFHIPGSFPLDLPSNEGRPLEEIEMLVNFMSSNVCKDSRIFIHCWVGVAANRWAETLVKLGFTNLHAAGPEGNSGIWQWKAAGYPLEYDDTFNPKKKKFEPKCLKKCCEE